jgi:hypothetical protein
MLVGAYDGAVDHLHAVLPQAAVVERLQNDVPGSGKRPAPELAVDRRPFAEVFVQVTLRHAGARDPEYPSKISRWFAGGLPLPAPARTRNGAKNAHSSSLISPRTTACSKEQP